MTTANTLVDLKVAVHDEYTTRAVLFAPDRTPATLAVAMLSWKATILTQEQSLFEITFPLYYLNRATGVRTLHPMASAEYGGNTAWEDKWLNWSFDWYGRGNRKFSGPVSKVTIAHKGDLSTAFVTLECVTFSTWGLNGRIIETDTNGPFIQAGPWDDNVRELMRTQVEVGFITKPSSYPVSPLRSDFGPFTYQVEGDVGDCTFATLKVQAGKSLGDTVREMSTSQADEADWLNLTCSESPAATFTLGVNPGRPGTVGAQIGSELTTTFLDGRRGTIAAAKFDMEWTYLASVYKVGGKGSGAGQGLTYVVDPTTAALVGCREDTVTLPKATTSEERELEAQKAVNDQKHGQVKRWEITIQETESCRAFVDFNVADAMPFWDAVTEEHASTEFIVLIEASFVSPGPVRVKVGFGRPERNANREGNRSGGGSKGGGRRGGGPPKSSDGHMDEDDVLSFVTIDCPAGSDPVADSATDTLTLLNGAGIAITGDSAADSVTVANTGALVAFTTIDCPAGSDPVADSATDTLTLIAGAGISITGDSAADSITFANTGPTVAFATVACPSGSSPVADAAADTLTLLAGAGLSITGDSSTDSVTFANTGALLSFTTIDCPSGTDPVADSATDTLTLIAGTGLSITGSAAADSITFELTCGWWNVITTDDGTVTAPAPCSALSLIGQSSCITTTVASGAIKIKWNGSTYGTVQGDSGSATAVAGTCGDTLKFVGGTCISTAVAEGSPDTVTIAFTGDTYRTITGNTGTANASGCGNSLAITGEGTFVTTVAAEGSPDSVVITWCLPLCTAGSDLGLYARVCTNGAGLPGGRVYGVKLYSCAP